MSSLFDDTIKGAIFYTNASNLEDVPDCAGVYAWYLPLRGDDSDDLLKFLSSLESNASKLVPASQIEASGQQRKLVVERNPPSFDMASSEIRRLADACDSQDVQRLSSLVSKLAFLMEPIYVGMTTENNGLKSRLQQHLMSVNSFDEDSNWSGSFRTRIAKILGEKDMLRKCLIAYIPIKENIYGPNAARLIEHILIRTIRPAQSKRG